MGCLSNLRAGALMLMPCSCCPSRTLSGLPGMAAGCAGARAGGRGTKRNVNCGVTVVNYAGFGAEYAVSVCVNGLQWVSSTPNFRTLRAEVAAKVTLTHEKEGSDGTRRHY